MKTHTLCRPPVNMHEVIRLGDDGKWRPDNKRPGLAFVGLEQPDKGQPSVDAIVWVAHCKCQVHLDCPVAKALDKAANMYGAARVERRRAYRAETVERKSRA